MYLRKCFDSLLYLIHSQKKRVRARPCLGMIDKTLYDFSSTMGRFTMLYSHAEDDTTVVMWQSLFNRYLSAFHT